VVVEGIRQPMWKWSASAGGAVVTGQAHSKQAAMVAAEKAIDRAGPRHKEGATCPARAIRMSNSADPAASFRTAGVNGVSLFIRRDDALRRARGTASPRPA